METSPLTAPVGRTRIGADLETTRIRGREARRRGVPVDMPGRRSISIRRRQITGVVGETVTRDVDVVAAVHARAVAVTGAPAPAASKGGAAAAR